MKKLKRWHGSIKRFAGVSILALGLSLLTSWAGHKNYWEGTIYAVQTTDFNILSHSLPTKLSFALLKNDLALIQETLDSNFGFFGLVVTDCQKVEQDCPEQKVNHITNSRKSWRKNFNIESLRNAPYSTLQDPPPLKTEIFFTKFSDTGWHSTKERSQGKIIGRVYYIRGIPPNFLESYSTWLLKLPSGSLFSFYDSQKYYSLSFFLFFTGALSLWFFLETIENQKQLKIIQANEKRLGMEVEIAQANEKLLEIENELYRLHRFGEVLSYEVNTIVSAPIRNQLQNLDQIRKNFEQTIARFRLDTQNVAHDLRKAPLLFKDTDEFLDNIDSHELLEDLKISIDFIGLSIENMEDMGNIEETEIDIKEQLKILKERLPSTVTRGINIIFDISCDQSIFIKCNGWRLQSIIRNCLYNATSALKDYKQSLRKANIDKFRAFEPSVKISCAQVESEVSITVEDNGPGIPDKIIDKLYQSPERLNNNFGQAKGNGSMIIYTYLTYHRGRVKIINLPNSSGAKVIFYFSSIS